MADLRDWIGANAGDVSPKLFNVPSGLLRILNRDLKHAGIQKRDERGRTLDVHALRHSFGTLLSKGNVAPRTAQAAMRHSSIDLTMNTYTDPKLLDVHAALDALPALPLTRDTMRCEVQTAPRKSAPLSAPNPENCSELGLIPDKMGSVDNEPIHSVETDGTNAKGLSQTSCDKPCESGRLAFPLSARNQGTSVDPSYVAETRCHRTRCGAAARRARALREIA
ncbi:MAG: tyrosine-type recombinase/integrase [Planctomycetia bacterium]|nr:tyrosine-type recombinase/integrase [Planctomycetia bacterium]